MDIIIGSVTEGLYAGAITLVKPANSSGSLGVPEPDWSNTTTVGSGTASITPVDERAAQAAGIIAAANMLRCICTLDVTPTPETHAIVANAVTYRIVSVKSWGEFYDLIIQEMTT